MFEDTPQLCLLGLKVPNQLEVHIVKLLLKRLGENGLLLVDYLFNYLFLLISEGWLLLLLHDRPLRCGVSPIFKVLNVHHVDIFKAIAIMPTGTLFHRHLDLLYLRLAICGGSVQWAHRRSQFFLDGLLHFV